METTDKEEEWIVEKLTVDEQLDMQRRLQHQYRKIWTPMEPARGRDQLLWGIIEAGEAADIIKKMGDQAILDDPKVRHDFIEEMADIVMYLNDVFLCYGITAEEYAEIYRAKFERNMKRWVDHIPED